MKIEDLLHLWRDCLTCGDDLSKEDPQLICDDGKSFWVSIHYIEKNIFVRVVSLNELKETNAFNYFKWVPVVQSGYWLWLYDSSKPNWAK